MTDRSLSGSAWRRVAALPERSLASLRLEQRCRESAALALLKRLDDLGCIRESAGVVLREDQGAVGRNIKDTDAAFDEFCLDVELLRNLGRQTGSLRKVVSSSAVSNCHAHTSPSKEAAWGWALNALSSGPRAPRP